MKTRRIYWNRCFTRTYLPDFCLFSKSSFSLLTKLASDTTFTSISPEWTSKSLGSSSLLLLSQSFRTFATLRFHTIDPMLSLRTSFETILSELQKRHRAYGELLEKRDPLRSCLALKFPAFTCEVKLDGERLLAHMQKGIVKLQVRFEFNSGPVMPSVCSMQSNIYNSYTAYHS